MPTRLLAIDLDFTLLGHDREIGDANRQAVRRAGLAKHLCESIGYEMEPAERRFRDAYTADLKTKMDETDFTNFYEQGRKLKLEEAVALCLEEINS